MSVPPRPSDPPLRVLRTTLGPVHVADVGVGPAVVALHGVPGSHRDFRWLAPTLEPDLRVVRPDLPGFGETPWNIFPARHPRDRAGLLVPLLDALEIDRCVLLGHSLGGALALEAAVAAPDRVAGLALVASSGLRPHRGYRRFRPVLWSRALDVPLLGALLRPVLRRAFTVMGFPRSTPTPALVHTMYCFGALDFASSSAAVQALTAPTLVAWTGDDPLIEPDVFRELAEAAPSGPRLSFARGGHNPQKTQAIELGEALVPFVREALAPAPQEHV